MSKVPPMTKKVNDRHLNQVIEELHSYNSYFTCGRNRIARQAQNQFLFTIDRTRGKCRRFSRLHVHPGEMDFGAKIGN